MLLFDPSDPLQAAVLDKLDRAIIQDELDAVYARATGAGLLGCKIDPDTGGYVYDHCTLTARCATYNNTRKGPGEILAWIERARYV